MAATKVEAVEHDDGRISLGVTRGKHFLPLVTVPAGQVAQLEAEAARAEGSDDENDEGGDN